MTPTERRSLPDTGIRHSASESPSAKAAKPAAPSSIRSASNSARRLMVCVLFVETLRRYINALPPDQIGWLAGARDPIIGQALALLHKEPAHPWTVANLARRIGLSRTRFAERFRHFLGESPIAYLAQWRLKLGAEILSSTEDSVALVATAVG